MIPEPIRITRQELYEQVWSMPMTKLAKKYGLSDVGLRKKCKKLNIPLPSSGYWAKKQYGKASPPPPLPPFEESDGITFAKKEKDELPVDEKQVKEAKTRIEFENRQENYVRVPDRLTSPHPLIRQAEEILQNSKPTYRDNVLLYPSNERCLDIKASKACLGRALRIMDAFIKALENRGFIISVITKDTHSQFPRYLTHVNILGETIEINMREALKQILYTPKDQRERLWHPKYDYIPSGKLSFSINEYIGDNVRKTWSDGKKQRLEYCLNSIIIGLIQAAVAKRSRELKWEKERQERREEERKREEEARRKREERERFLSLLRQTENWNKGRQIREYVEAVRQDAIGKNGRIESNSELDKWLTWANEQADRMDPLKQ